MNDPDLYCAARPPRPARATGDSDGCSPPRQDPARDEAREPHGGSPAPTH